MDTRKPGPPGSRSREIDVNTTACHKEGNKEGDGKVRAEEEKGEGEEGGGRKAATSRVIARISKCVYKLGHRRVCSLIRHSDAEERRAGGEEEEGEGEAGGSGDSPGDKGIGC